MTTYGLTPTGPVRKPALAIRSDIVESVKDLPGFGEARTSTGSVEGNQIDAFTDQLSQVWEAWEAGVLSFSKDSAEDQALDALLTLVGKSRILATYTTVSLTLWTKAATPVSVPAGNLVEQSATAVQFETLDDAEIPGATVMLEDKAVGAITWVSGNVVKYYLPASTDLSSVVAGNLLIVTGSSVSGNNGAFPIVSVNDGGDWVTATNPNRSDATGNEADSDAKATITNGIITVNAQATAKGAITAAAQSIDTIANPIADWDGVVNLAAGTTGRDLETNSALRRRASAELTIAQGSTLAAIKAKLLAVDGVRYVSGQENRTSTTVDGLKPHSYHFTIAGTFNSQDVINVLGATKAGGIDTNGSISGTYTDPEGNTETLYYDEPTEKNPWIIANITKDSSYPTDGDTLVSDALLTINATLTEGDDLLNWQLMGAVYAAGIPGIVSLEILQGWSDPPTLSANLSVGADEVAVLVAEQITVNS